MKVTNKNIVTKKAIIILWIMLGLFVITSDAVSAEFSFFSNFIQISIVIVIIILCFSFFISFYLSIKTQNILYFSRIFITILVLVVSLFILNCRVGNSITNIIRGTPKLIAELRGVQLVLRENNNFDIWYPSSFPLLNVKKIYAGNYIINNEEIKFLYDYDTPNGFSSNAKYQSDDVNRKVIRFILPDKSKFDYYILN